MSLLGKKLKVVRNPEHRFRHSCHGCGARITIYRKYEGESLIRCRSCKRTFFYMCRR